ncbi:DNA glycosylase, partial [Tanacetum coccineum]
EPREDIEVRKRGYSLYRHYCVVMISILFTPRVSALAGCDIAYHDEEQGVLFHDDKLLFELLVFTIAQVGSDWTKVLKKRQQFRCAWKYSAMKNVTDPASTDVHQYNLMHIRPSSLGGTIVATTDLVKEHGVDNRHCKVCKEYVCAIMS